ncbi:RteC domain-containing protein [Lutibacter sp. A64]|uniref:RteC domain-containing protein n=1 Tax=Lutibacter sp. A64 TaxID=2918526 RepID=UPI001F052A9E|nr:RteC domain-containing protein [Lutibacter sp. A64]UMB55332.1 RteC domain-containing protein [Lutibacter sp. A64]
MSKIVKIIEQFDASINEIDKSNLNLLNSLNLKIKINQNCLVVLRKEVKQKGFSSQKSEITFFKNQKPYIKGRLKFYLALNDYYLGKPAGEKSKIRKYINLKLSEISNENCKYNGFRNYIKLEKSYKDNLYFLRIPNQLELLIEDTPLNNPNIFEDPDFCTSRDHLVAMIVKNDLLCQFFTNELEINKKKNSKPLIQEVQSIKIPWTGTKTELVELLFASNAEGSIGNGNLSLKEIKEICINNFGVDPGNIYQIVDQITTRKGNPIKFIDRLKTSLSNEINNFLKKGK